MYFVPNERKWLMSIPLGWLAYRRFECCLLDAVQKFCQILISFHLSVSPVCVVSVEDIRSSHIFSVKNSLWFEAVKSTILTNKGKQENVAEMVCLVRVFFFVWICGVCGWFVFNFKVYSCMVFKENAYCIREVGESKWKSYSFHHTCLWEQLPSAISSKRHEKFSP